MTTYVLIPGFWLGAWAWQPVAKVLRSYGHEVHPLSLTGMGERAHLARPDTDLEVHIADVLNLLRYEDLRDVVLVGHSYAGAAVTRRWPTDPTDASPSWSLSTPVHCPTVLPRPISGRRTSRSATLPWSPRPGLRRTSRHLGDDLRHFVEHGTPSARKQRQAGRRRQA